MTTDDNYSTDHSPSDLSDTANAATTSNELEEAALPSYPALFYLFFRPRVFFGHFLPRLSSLSLAVTVVLVGFGHAMDRFELQALRGRTTPDTWDAYYLSVLGTGLVGGFVSYFVLGWWYWIRLRLAGGLKSDYGAACRVFAFCSLVYALPLLAYTLFQSMLFNSPSDARNAEGGLIDIAVGLAIPWSIAASFVGARHYFGTRLKRSVLLFIVLPGTFYVVTLGGMAYFLLSALADVAHPNEILSSLVF